MSRGPDAGTALIRALEHAAERAQVEIALVRHDWTRWASATFTGARHEQEYCGPASERLDQWLASLPETDLPIRGHLVADIAVARRSDRDGQVTFALEALTVEAR